MGNSVMITNFQNKLSGSRDMTIFGKQSNDVAKKKNHTFMPITFDLVT